MVITYVAHPCFYLAEIMGNNVDMKKLRAKLGGRRDFMADLRLLRGKKVMPLIPLALLPPNMNRVPLPILLPVCRLILPRPRS